MRSIVTWALVVVGLGLAVLGYMLAAPWGADSVADSDPVFVGAPLIFIIGIVSILAAAGFYELLPSRDDDRTS